MTDMGYTKPEIRPVLPRFMAPNGHQQIFISRRKMHFLQKTVSCRCFANKNKLLSNMGTPVLVQPSMLAGYVPVGCF